MVGVAILISFSCVMPVRIGRFTISGVVIEDKSESPLKGVRVHAYFSRSSFCGPVDDLLIGYAWEDQSGRFEFEVEKRTSVGWTGGSSGRLRTMPSFWYEKEGYRRVGLIITESSTRSKKEQLEELQNIAMREEHPGDNENCVVTGAES